MNPLKIDFSIYEKFNFEKIPVGIKFMFSRPDGIEALDKKLGFCEMLKEAHQRKTPFYFTKEHEDCFGKAALGMMEEDKPFGESGLIGYKWGVFQDPRANGHLFYSNYHIGKGVVNYVAFSPLSKLTFDPDLIIFMVKTKQAEILLRAMTYTTGEIYESKVGPVLGCSWLYIYPYMSGKVNYMITGLVHGMKGRAAFPDGWILVSVPYNWIPTITQSLNEMKWDLPEYEEGREKFLQERDRIMGEVVREFQSK